MSHYLVIVDWETERSGDGWIVEATTNPEAITKAVAMATLAHPDLKVSGAQIYSCDGEPRMIRMKEDKDGERASQVGTQEEAPAGTEGASADADADAGE